MEARGYLDVPCVFRRAQPGLSKLVRPPMSPLAACIPQPVGYGGGVGGGGWVIRRGGLVHSGAAAALPESLGPAKDSSLTFCIKATMPHMPGNQTHASYFEGGTYASPHRIH
jgi:hypothetical protein